MKLLIGLAFLIIIGSLASAFVFLMKDRSKSSRTVNALSVRIGMSVLLFILILFSYYMGWIESTGLR